MKADRRAMAQVMLDLIGGSASDEALAASFGEHEAVADGVAYLAGFAVEALALQRRESVPATVRYLRLALDTGDDDGGDGWMGCVSRDAHVLHRADWRRRLAASTCRSRASGGRVRRQPTLRSSPWMRSAC